MDEVDVTIIGSGLIGLAVASELSSEYESVIVLEKNDTFGLEISSRNSEVIHAGIYYPPGSLKARMCVRGAELLYNYCREHSIPHSKIGKLIVASDRQSELDRLQFFFENALENGVKGLSIIEKPDISKMEPSVLAAAAIYSPCTGIVDSHSLMKHLYHKASSSGVMFSFRSEVVLVSREKEGYLVGIKEEDYRFVSRVIINSAGLYSDMIADLAGIDIDNAGYRLEYCKGTYFSYEKKSPVSMLIYPLPGESLSGLGIHATLDLAGQLRFGPDSERVGTLDYKVESGKQGVFFEAASRYIKDLDREAFVPDMTGIRPGLRGEGFHDFIIQDESEKGLPGLINLIGIESPGLTAALEIARHIRSLLKEV
jgi:L-2-hydroxyglutarate oxidase LhgO